MVRSPPLDFPRRLVWSHLPLRTTTHPPSVHRTARSGQPTSPTNAAVNPIWRPPQRATSAHSYPKAMAIKSSSRILTARHGPRRSRSPNRSWIFGSPRWRSISRAACGSHGASRTNTIGTSTAGLMIPRRTNGRRSNAVRPIRAPISTSSQRPTRTDTCGGHGRAAAANTFRYS